MISRSSTSCARALVWPDIARSAEIVPMICPRWIRGTQTNESASSGPRDCVRFKKRRSLRTSQTTSALPVLATSPVIPSPTWYRPSARSSALSARVEATILSSSPSRSVNVPRNIPMLRSRMPRTFSRSLRTSRSRATAEAISRRTAISDVNLSSISLILCWRILYQMKQLPCHWKYHVKETTQCNNFCNCKINKLQYL